MFFSIKDQSMDTFLRMKVNFWSISALYVSISMLFIIYLFTNFLGEYFMTVISSNDSIFFGHRLSCLSIVKSRLSDKKKRKVGTDLSFENSLQLLN